MPQLTAPPCPRWRFLPHLLLLAFILRAAVALSGNFIIHPDETMQYIEPAHALVFGNGILHWEHYFGARSWLVPGAIAAILFLCKLLGLGEPVYYIPAVRLTLCAFSLLIPLGMYHLGRRLFGEASGRAALLLGVFWYELVGFAHKPMTEFVATAMLLALLAFTLRPQRLTRAQAAAASAFAVLIVAVRPQYAPLLGFLWLIPFWHGDARTRLLMLAAAAAAGGAIGGFDKLTWGTFLHPYRIIFHYNAGLDEFRTAYEETFGRYLFWQSITSGGLIWLALTAVPGSRQRLFVLLLCLAVVIPHELQAHREHRYIYAVIPLWLLLCADCLANGWRWRHSLPAAARGFSRKACIGCWFALVSTAGIANALPGQQRVYDEHNPLDPQNRTYRHLGYFLRNQDEVFALYRQLAADDSVRGVKDALRVYSDSGGYYMLHRKVPLYDRISDFPHEQARRFVSHIIASPLATVHGVKRKKDSNQIWLAQNGEVRLRQLPIYTGDATLNKLVYWDKNGQPSVVEGFVLDAASRQFSLWKAQPPAPVAAWKNYRVYLRNADQYEFLSRSMGAVHKPPLNHHGYEFADSPAAE